MERCRGLRQPLVVARVGDTVIDAIEFTVMKPNVAADESLLRQYDSLKTSATA